MGSPLGLNTVLFRSSVTFECPSGALSVIFTSDIHTEVAISTLQNSCTCMGCPSGGIVQCTFYQDGKKLEPTDTVLAAVAASAQSTTPLVGRLASSQRAMAACLLCGLVLVQFCC
eukprot:jgi/Picre1/33816/NNA_001295.t1